MNPNAVCQLLLFADNIDAHHLPLPEEARTHSGVKAAMEFLAAQRWILWNDDRWSITPIGRLWIRSVQHHYDLVKSYQWRGETFLVHTRSNQDELIVWHSGRFVTIVPAYAHFFRSPGPYVLRKDAELTTTSAGPEPEDALTAACVMLVQTLDIPEPADEANAGIPHRHQLRRLLERL